MRVVVTGASGFLGSWICRILSESHQVFAIMREDSDGFRVDDIEKLKTSKICPTSWRGAISEFEPDVIVACHWSGVGNQDRNSPNQFDNLNLMIELASYAIESKLTAFIALGSQAELGPVPGPILENMSDNPTTVYGEAKVRVRSELERIFLDSPTRFLWARIFSTYGPLDSDSWLIPSVISKLLKGEKVELTPGTQRWSFLHAIDAAFAIRKVIDEESISGIVHLGNPTTLEVRDAVNYIANQLDKISLLEFGAIPFRDDQVVSMMPVCTKLESVGWFPQVHFEEGVSELISWMRGSNTFSWTDNHLNRKSIFIPARPQIQK